MRDHRLRGVLVASVFAGAVCIAVAYASTFLRGGAPRWGSWCMVAGLALLLVATMALGAVRTMRDVRRLSPALLFTFVVLLGGLGAGLLLPASERAGSTLLLGLPLRAALVLYGVGLVPLLVLPLVYALTFDDMTLREEDIERVRRAAAEHRAASEAP